MNRHLIGRHVPLLLRSYLLLASALLAVAMVLDLGFTHLQPSQTSGWERLSLATLRAIEVTLARTPTAQRRQVARELSASIEIPMELLSAEQVALPGDTRTADLESLIDDDKRTVYLYHASSIDQFIYLGPIGVDSAHWALKLLPTLFYASIFIIVGLWLRPLLRDLDLITGAAQRFAADYREPLDTSHKTHRLTWLARHLDEMSARLSALIQNQKELSAALSHEIRTPLARIRFAIALSDDQDRSRRQARQQAINADVQEIDDLVSTMLNYARLDHPDLQMNWQRTPLAAWLHDIGERVALGEKTLDIDVEETVGQEDMLMDPYLMGLAARNLLGNAARHATGHVLCVAYTRGGQHHLEVHDDGRGIPAEHRTLVFKAFNRVDDSRSRHTGGFGLGLAIVARIAQLHGGEASAAASERLGGALLSLRWPAVAERNARRRAP